MPVYQSSPLATRSTIVSTSSSQPGQDQVDCPLLGSYTQQKLLQTVVIVVIVSSKRKDHESTLVLVLPLY